MNALLRHAHATTIALLLLPTLAFAQGSPQTQLRLSWDRCAGDGKVADRSFACDTNTGEDVLYVSAVLGDEVPHANVGAYNAFIDIRPMSTTVVPWWQLGFGECRANALQVQGAGLDVSPLCTPWYLADGVAHSGEPLAVFSSEYDSDGAGFPRWNFGVAVPGGQEVNLPTGPQEYLLARIHIRHSKTTGTGSCAGCTVPTCIGFGMLQLQNPSLYTILGTAASTVTWQGAYVTSYDAFWKIWPGGFVNRYHGFLGCSTGPVPAQNHTWGSIKTMYR